MIQSPLLVEKRREALRQAMLDLGGRVAVALRASLDALKTGDLMLARGIVEADPAINHQRRVIEQDGLLALAAYEPAGSDLRSIAACVELVPELERIADYAADVARILIRHADAALPPALMLELSDLGEAALAMFQDAMGLYGGSTIDANAARVLAARDDQVDALQRALLDTIVELIQTQPDAAAAGVAMSWIAHNYERVADRATNIAERLIYIASGETPDLD